MEWTDIACIVFTCVTMNHLGLIKAIEGMTGFELPVIGCVKCSTFWCVLLYMAVFTHNVITMLAVSFLASYLALWVELFECFIDRLYMTLYGKITAEDNDDTASADADSDSAAGTMPDV